MMGFLYVLLCFAAGWALTDRFLPDLRSPALNVHRILGTATFLGARRYPDAVRAGAALDARTRRVVGMAVGDRDEFTARCLWDSLSRRYRNRAIVATGLLPVYRAVSPAGQHAPALLIAQAALYAIGLIQLRIDRTVVGQELGVRVRIRFQPV